MRSSRRAPRLVLRRGARQRVLFADFVGVYSGARRPDVTVMAMHETGAPKTAETVGGQAVAVSQFAKSRHVRSQLRRTVGRRISGAARAHLESWRRLGSSRTRLLDLYRFKQSSGVLKRGLVFELAGGREAFP
jgi:hypothetical protein